jgi:hypothetical protein
LDCPCCTAQFSLIAIDLVPVSDGESRFPHAVINLLS